MGRCTTPAPPPLVDLGTETDAPFWSWSIVNLEPIGRVILPGHARQALARSPGDPKVRARAARVTWVLAKGGTGAQTSVDARGRVYLPAWLRPACSSGALVGTRSTDGLVVVCSTGVLDAFGDRLAAPVR